MRFVHVADVHLDTSFPGRSDGVRRRLREASREAFRAAVDLALREDVHALLVAGDLFDSERLSFATERFLLEEARRLGEHGITLVYATGNHDPGSREAGPRSLPWPPNVRVAADGTPRRIAITGHDGRTVGHVTAVGHATSGIRDDLSRRLPKPQGDLPEVAVLHTQVHASAGSAEHHPYAPSELSYLTRAGYDYWALGHVHVRQVLAQDPPVVYPGSLQGKSHADTGPRGAYLVDLADREAPLLVFRPLAPVRWETLTVDGLEEADSLDRLERRVATQWEALRTREEAGGPAPEWMVRVALAGSTPLWRELRRPEDLRTLEQELREVLGVLDVVVQAGGVHPALDLSEHRARTDVLGEALRLLDRVARGDAPLPGLAAADLAGLPAADPRTVESEVRRLLAGTEGELASRLLGLGGESP